ncbi:MAG: hypothetical protein H7249_00770 [Chitinophagaceae bacterium]|nr:hypothetical protein [Oligoflexus sp.]
MKILILFIHLLLIAACGTKSKAGPYAELTPKEKARIALDDKDFQGAVVLYKAVIADDPKDFESYRFLAAAYAEEGGFDILKAVSGTVGSSSSNLLTGISKFLPAEPTDAQIEALKLSTKTLLSLPEEQRSTLHPEIPSASSAAQQLQFYQAAYSLIYLNKFTKITPSGAVDPSQLATMSNADVDNILNNFTAIATAAGGGAVAEGADAFMSQLNSMPGETRRDKLISYLAAHPS